MTYACDKCGEEAVYGSFVFSDGENGSNAEWWCGECLEKEREWAKEKAIKTNGEVIK